MSLKQTLKKCIALLRRQTNTLITLQKLHRITYKTAFIGGGGQYTLNLARFATEPPFNKAP